MKKIFTMILVVMMVINVIPVHALEYDVYQKGDKIKVKVNDTTSLEFYVIEDTGNESDSIKAIYSGVLDGTYNYDSAKSNLNNLKSTWKNVSEITFPSMEEIFGSNVNLSQSFTYTLPTWALSSSRYWTLNEEDSELQSLKDIILKNNDAQDGTNIDYSKSSAEDGTQGLYYVNTKDEKTTYFFRGNVNNNYVKFGKVAHEISVYKGYSEQGGTGWYESLEACEAGATVYGIECSKVVLANEGDDMYWRIVRINEDGSIRLIYQGNSPSTTGEYSTIGISTFNMAEQSKYDPGYMYKNENDETYTNSNSSEIKKYIDKWYEENLKNEYGIYLADAGFCGDRIEYDNPHSSEVLWYGSYYRTLETYQPSFTCSNASTDLYTLNTSLKGNKALTYPIGLLTADEAIYAGSGAKSVNNNFYLSTTQYWTMSPAVENGGGNSVLIFTPTSIFGSSNFTHLSISSRSGVRPVINLKAEVKTTEANGTSDNPYVISIADTYWTLGGSETGIAETKEISETLSIKPVITIKKSYVEKLGDDGLGDTGNVGDSDQDKEETTNPETGDDIIIIIGTTLVLSYLAVYTYKKRKIHN